MRALDWLLCVCVTVGTSAGAAGNDPLPEEHPLRVLQPEGVSLASATPPPLVSSSGVSTQMVPTGIGDTLNWLQQIGTEAQDQGQAVAVTDEGSYTVGHANSAFDGNTALGQNDFIIVKHNAAGAKLWSKQYGTNAQDYGMGVATYMGTTPHQVYLAGYTAGAFGGANQGVMDAVLLRVDPGTGSTVWSRQFGSTATDLVMAVTTDKNGAIYVAGHTMGSIHGQANAGGFDMFLTKYNSAGTWQWTRQLGTPNIEQVRGVATDANDNVYVAGHTDGNLGGPNAGNADLFLAKYNSAGTLSWVKQMGTSQADSIYGVATSRRLDNTVDVYVVGYTGASFDGQPYAGGLDAIVVKFAADGTKVWSRQMGSAGNDMAQAIASDGGANVYITGRTNYDLDTNTSADSDNIFMVKYDAAGTKLVTRQLGSVNALDPTKVMESGNGIAADINDRVYIAGFTEGEFTNPTTMNTGEKDVLLLQYKDGCQVNTPGECGISYGWGDPHLGTFDGLAYDFQGVGEFILVESIRGTPLTVQARMRPWNGSNDVSVMTALATLVGSSRVGFYLGTNPPVKVNGAAVSLAVGNTVPLPGGGRLRRKDASSYIVYYPGHDRLIVTLNNGYIDANFALPTSRQGTLRGLLGNYNGKTNDDLALRTGAVLAQPLTFAQLYTSSSSMAASWRIKKEESLFDYGQNEDTWTFTDVNFPWSPISVADLTPAQLELGLATCRERKVKTAAFFDRCVLDVGLTGVKDFALTAALLEGQILTQRGGDLPSQEQGGKRVYFANFQSEEPRREWSEWRWGKSPSGDKFFLGEFGNNTVDLALTKLPAHSTVVVSFDLILAGTWDGDGSAGPHSWGVAADGKALLDTTFSNTDSKQSYPSRGSLPGTGADAIDSLGYSKGDSLYRLKFTLSHKSADLKLNFFAYGLKGETWGLDNVEVLVY
ncbi:von Willebrand factor type D domain protein [Stigmatella aurantiaca DW4/3-1]|uniref:von Willebrand factor type D domain protein n=3 Tax=Stigmatella aurantiaca TaxID=41 RepID=Q093N2_STIAD|nr:von Willebrand factor type D domain protein [Stigmatella aurantiaca DW4/3-1]